jgi:hypothetical protein
MIDQLNLIVWAWIESFRGMKQRGIWIPFLCLALVQWILLLLLVGFYQPFLAWLLVPLLKAAGAGMVLHYPQLYLALPTLFSRASLLVDFVVGTLFFGLGFLMVYAAAAGLSGQGAWEQTRRAYLKLLAVRFPSALFTGLLFFVLPRLLPSGEAELHGQALRLLRYGTFLAGVAVEALFVYAPLALLVPKRSLGGAFRETFALAGRMPLATLLVVLGPNLIQLPMAAVLRRSDSVVQNLTPEAVGWMMAGSVAIYALINYLIIGSAVRIFGARSQTVAGGRS